MQKTMLGKWERLFLKLTICSLIKHNKKKNGRGQGATTAIFQAFFIHKEGGRTDGTVRCAAPPIHSYQYFYLC